MKKILIADDHSVVRSGLKLILNTLPGDVQVDEVKDGREVLGHFWQHNYDLVILDISLPGRNGLDILGELVHAKPDIPVIILSMYSEDQYAIRAIKAGAAGYLTKDCDPEDILQAIEKVFAGKKHFSDAVIQQLIEGVNRGWEKAPHETLSPREMQVMSMIARGESLSDIADRLAISISSVSTHRRRLLKKLHLKSNAEIVRYALQHQLID